MQSVDRIDRIETLQALPVENQAEVFDLVEFLEVRGSGVEPERPVHHQWTDVDSFASFMVDAIGGLDKDQDLYLLDEIRGHSH